MNMAHACAPAPSIAASLMSPARRQVMADVFSGRFQRPIRLLEVGVWQAAGSTQFWLEHLPAGSELVLLDAWRPYASPADLIGGGTAPSSWNYAAMDAEADAAFDAACARVRQYERAQGRGAAVTVHLLRAPAAQAMAWMADGAFDVVYVDGDHKYEQVRQDLTHAARLVNRRDGLVCGDDLERLPDPATIALARKHLGRDYLGPPHRFHPGVCLAVHEVFGEVRMADGFWWTHFRAGAACTDAPANCMENAR